jgi:predicted nucleic acid-binding Zn finger protein
MSKITTEVIKMWAFRSSNGKTMYQTLQFADAFISCDCPGWTKRVTASGGRDCKHVRMVQLNLADQTAESFADLRSGSEKLSKIVKQSTRPAVTTPVRAFNLDE